MSSLPACRCIFTCLECRPFPDRRKCDCQRYDHSGDQFQPLYRHDFCIQDDSVDKTVNNRTDDGGDDTSCHTAASEDGFTDDQAGKTDHDDTRAAVDVGGILVLTDHCAGECGQRIGDA